MTADNVWNIWDKWDADRFKNTTMDDDGPFQPLLVKTNTVLVPMQPWRPIWSTDIDINHDDPIVLSENSAPIPSTALKLLHRRGCQLPNLDLDLKQTVTATLSMKSDSPKNYLQFKSCLKTGRWNSVLGRNTTNFDALMSASELTDDFKLIASILARVVLSSLSIAKTGRKASVAILQNFEDKKANNPSVNDKQPKPSFSESSSPSVNQSISGVKTTVFVQEPMNHAICDDKITSFSSDSRAIFKTAKGNFLAPPSLFWLLPSVIQAYEIVIVCAITVTVRLLFLAEAAVNTAILNYCRELLLVKGDDFKSERLAKASEKNCEIVCLAMNGQMDVPQGCMFAQGGMMGRGGEVPVFNGQIGQEDGNGDDEFMEEIPDFENFGFGFGDGVEEAIQDDDIDRDEEEFNLRMRSGFQERGIRRVPSISGLAEVDDFMGEDEEGDAFAAAAGELGGYANQPMLHHGDIAALLRQIEEEDNPIPVLHEPEPANPLGLANIPVWLEEPIMFLDHQMLLEVDAAHAA